MNSLTFKNLCIAFLALTLALSAGLLAHRSDTSIRQVTPEVVQTVKQAKVAAFEVQAMAKALKQEAGDPVQIAERGRLIKSANLVLAGTAQTIGRLNGETIPALNDAISELRAQIASTGNNVNTVLLPEAGRIARSFALIAEKFQVDQQALTLQVAAAVKSGQMTLDSLTKLLSSDRLEAILANVDGTTREFNATAANVTETTRRMPTIAEQIEKILRTSAQYQKPILIASLLATIARIFF